jgi:hypothetical protein
LRRYLFNNFLGSDGLGDGDGTGLSLAVYSDTDRVDILVRVGEVGTFVGNAIDDEKDENKSRQK